MLPFPRDRWHVLSPYVDRALDLAPEARGPWLASLEAIDALLARDLRSLLLDRSHTGFLEGTALETLTSDTPPLTGQVIGAYRLVELLGQGGSGMVWRAERCDGRFEGQAAIKLLDLALIGRSGEERFRREGTILARLTHPGIAHLIDAGVSPTGQPYLVLELVEGQAIDRYAAEQGLDVASRLRLFLDVLAAVAHAHANLIVHRDIKPGNVLVSVDRRVKLLDFGIAQLVRRASDGDEPVAGPLTREIRRALTPAFAAPEQLAGGCVTTATDVYALGVLLYVLLSGRHPAGGRVNASASLVRAVLDEEPPPVSMAVIDDRSEEVAGHAPRRGSGTARLRRALRGDLDTIVAKALRNDPAQRYVSVAAFADDIRRYLDREPIAARGGAVAYRTGRFLRRHVRSVAGVAIAVVCLVSMALLYATRLATERDRAQREAAKAVKVSEMLMSVLTSADPYAIRSGAGEPTMRSMLDEGADRVRRELANEPGLQAEMLGLLGRTYRRLGEYDKAQALLVQAVDNASRAADADPGAGASALAELGVVLVDQGDYTGAARTLERALVRQRALLGARHPDVAITLAELGRVYQDQGLSDRAEALHREALAIRRAVLGEEHPQTAVSQSDLASVLRLAGDVHGADALLRLSLETNRQTRGATHPNTATTLHDLALVTAGRGNWAEAERELRTVLGMQQSTMGPSHPTVATTLNSLARAEMALGRPRDAALTLDRALAIVEPVLGPEHQLVAIYALNRAAAYVAMGETAAALPRLAEAVTARSRAPLVVPARRRTMASDDWDMAAANALLAAATGTRRAATPAREAPTPEAQRRVPIVTQ